MKMDVAYESHEKYTEDFPFIFHKDIIKGGEPEDDVAIIFRNGERHYYAAGRTNWHKNIELLYFFDGEGELHAGNTTYKTHKNELYVINSNDLHSVSSPSYTSYYCLIIDRNFCRQNDCAVEKLRFLNEDPANETLSRLFAAVVRAFDAEDALRDLKIKSTVLSLLCELATAHASPTEVSIRTEKNAIPIKTALHYIEENLTKRLTLADVASAAGMSKYYFANAFRRAVGCTCIDYINSMRCHLAQSLLAKGEHTVSEVCYLCGFENLSYFSRTFHRYMGMLPSACRKKESGRGKALS